MNWAAAASVLWERKIPMLSSAKKRIPFCYLPTRHRRKSGSFVDACILFKGEAPQHFQNAECIDRGRTDSKRILRRNYVYAAGVQFENKLYTNEVRVFEFFTKVLGLSKGHAEHDALICIFVFPEKGVEQIIAKLLKKNGERAAVMLRSIIRDTSG